jgi:predicted GNAT family acetyltransferase
MGRMKEQQQAPGEVSNNEAQSRYELRMDGRVAGMAQYTLEGRKVRFTHTEVEAEHEGQGLGSKLAAYALDDVRRRGLKVVPQCKFIAAYIARHEQEYGELVDRS